MTESSTRRVAVAPLLLSVFILVSVSPIVPPQWYGVMGVVASVLMGAVVFTRDRTAVALALFGPVVMLSYGLNPWRFWPMGMLVPLASFALFIGLIPPLRRAVPLPSRVGLTAARSCS